MNDNKSFIKAKNKGKKGETAVKEYFINKGYDVIDVSENKEFQKMDIDLIIDGDFVEVKTQSCINRSNKIVLELETEYYNSLFRKGWLYYTEANILMFHDKENNITYSVDTDELRKLFDKYKDSKEIDYYYFDEESKISTLVYMPIDLIQNQLKSFKTIIHEQKTI